MLPNRLKLSDMELNLTTLCHYKLISDDTKRRALLCQEIREFRSVIYTDLKSKHLVEDFLDILQQFENTRSDCAMLEGDCGSSGRCIEFVDGCSFAYCY